MKPYDNETNIKDTSVFRKDLVVTDVVYNPIKTKMILDAEEAGCKVIGGKGMLLYQGVEAFKLFMECEMPVEEVKAKLAKHTKEFMVKELEMDEKFISVSVEDIDKENWQSEVMDKIKDEELYFKLNITN